MMRVTHDPSQGAIAMVSVSLGGWLTLVRARGWGSMPPAQSETSVISLPQQQVGLAVPGQSGGAPLVTVTSQPQAGSGQR